MKKALKKLDNKGFTLVELIIVIAIIAVLAAVLAPQYIKYVERSRQGVDANALQEVFHNVQVEAGLVENATAATKVTVTGATGALGGDFANLSQVEGIVGPTITFKSKAAAAFTTYTINIAVDGTVTWDGAGATPTGSAAQVAKLEKGTATT